jgi:hypothetical protein
MPFFQTTSKIKVTKFGNFMCTYFLSKLGSYTIGSAFARAFQRYMACLTWRRNTLGVVDQSFGGP